MIPARLHDLSIASLLFGAICAAVTAMDEIRHPEYMGIMNVVWPVTALFATVWVVWQSFAYGRLATYEKAHTAIAPMHDLSFGQGIIAAAKADTLSSTVSQVGLYGFMAIASFVIFRNGFGVKPETDTPSFWFMMQIAMMFGFAAADPVNWWLLRAGIKEAMLRSACIPERGPLAHGTHGLQAPARIDPTGGRCRPRRRSPWRRRPARTALPRSAGPVGTAPVS